MNLDVTIQKLEPKNGDIIFLKARCALTNRQYRDIDRQLHEWARRYEAEFGKKIIPFVVDANIDIEVGRISELDPKMRARVLGESSEHG